MGIKTAKIKYNGKEAVVEFIDSLTFGEVEDLVGDSVDLSDITKPKIDLKYTISNIKNLEKITAIFFSNKRKMINKPLSKTFKEYKDVAKKLKLNLSSRPSELSCNDYYRITEYYEKTKMI